MTFNNHGEIMIFDMITIMYHLYDLEESASHPSPSPRGSAPSLFLEDLYLDVLAMLLFVCNMILYDQINLYKD